MHDKFIDSNSWYSHDIWIHSWYINLITVKLPQILILLNKRSTKGLSVSSIFMETVGVIITVFYCYLNNYNILSYGEIITLMYQNFIILFLILWIRQNRTTCVLLSAIFFGSFLLLKYKFISIVIITYLQVYLSFPISSLAKVFLKIM